MVIGILGTFLIVTAAVIWHERLAPRRSPQFAAFSTTLATVLFIVTGLIGFGLQKGPALFSEARWSESVIWPQVWLGLAFLPAAAICWHRALKDADRRVGRLRPLSK